MTMTVQELLLRTLAGALMLVAGATHHAAVAEGVPNGPHVSFGVSGHVALRCEARVEQGSDGPGLSPGEGRLVEACNDSAGYEVHADCSPDLRDATLFVDGVAVELKASGSVLISTSMRPQRTLRHLRLEVPAAAGSAPVIRFRIVPGSKRI
jgi:hypothetical protein